MGSRINLIACVGRNGELGNKGKLCFHLKDDMKFFVEQTKGHTVIMGRKTYEGIGHPLPDRRNIVITHKKIEGVECSESLPFVVGKLLGEGEEKIYIIGGASIYEQALPFVDTLYLTEVDADAEADVYFPKFEKRFFDSKILKEGEENGLKYKIKEYEKCWCLWTLMG